MNKKTFLEWFVVSLIILFFAVPLYILAINEPVTHWTTAKPRFVYNFLFK